MVVPKSEPPLVEAEEKGLVRYATILTALEIREKVALCNQISRYIEPELKSFI